MISIGDFARLGRVSVRMLRHYDTIGLLRPEHVDSNTGYRYYRPEQLRRLNRIVALKDLGLRLGQVRSIVDEQLTGDQLRAMLRLRHAELESQILDGEHRLARVQARLRLIDAEETMTHPNVITKTVPAMTVVGLTAVAASATQEDVGPVVGPMHPVIMQQLAAAGVSPSGPGVALEFTRSRLARSRPAETVEFTLSRTADERVPFVRGEPENQPAGIPAVTDTDPAVGQVRNFDAVAVGETQGALYPVRAFTRGSGQISERRYCHVASSLIVVSEARRSSVDERRRAGLAPSGQVIGARVSLARSVGTVSSRGYSHSPHV